MTGVEAALLVVAGAYGVVSGFNDGGSLLASFTSGRVLSPRTAALLLVVIPLGPLVLGTAVAETVGVSVIDLRAAGTVGFAVVVAVSIGVVLLSWQVRIPTSMTLALVGAMLGWAAAGHAAIRWPGVLRVLVGMPVSVIGGGLAAFVLYRLVRLLLGGMAHRHLLLIARLQVTSAALQAFAYGANDLEKTIGLIAVARVVDAPGAPVSFHDAYALGAAFLCFLAGALVGGWRLAYRLGFGVFRVRPVQAMSAQTGAGLAVAALSLFGAPVSSTQTINGSLVGVGAAARASAIRWGVVREMVASWLVTLPLALLVAGALRVLAGLVGLAR